MNVTKQLYQWDTGQKLTECTGIYVDFLIGSEVYRVEVKDGTCIIPDELLQTSGRYKVWECMADNTLREFAFKVLPRPIPPNYVFTPTEQLTFEGLVQKETNKFNTNAIEKLNAYNANADNRVAEFNAQTEQIQSDVSELKSDLVQYDNGIKRISDSWVYGTLDSNGQIIPFSNNSRSVNTDYFIPTEGVTITIDINFGAILCEYNSDETLVSRRVLVNGDYNLDSGKLYRICIFDSVSQTEQATPYEYSFKAHYSTNINKRISSLESKGLNLDRIDSDVYNLKLNVSKITNDYASITPSWELGSWDDTTGEDSSSTVIARTSFILDEDMEVKISVNSSHQLRYGYYDEYNVWHHDKRWTIGTDLKFTAIGGYRYKFKACGTTQYAITDLSEFGTNFVFKIRYIPITDYVDMAMFDDIAVCGDSYTVGSIFSTANSGTESNTSELIGDNTKTRWGSVLGRISGCNVTTYASGGADTSTWQTRPECLPKVLSDDAHQLYILCLGINDRTYTTKGTIEDIKDDYSQNPNTFYGNYGKIITQIKAHAPNAKIIISKVFIVTYQTGAYYQWSSEAIEEIANKFDIPFIDTADEEFFSSDFYNNNMRGGHPIAPTYAGMARGMKKLIDKCIQDNVGYFSDYYPN